MTQTKLASPELAGVEIHGVTRGAFIMKGALAASAVYGTSAVAPFVSQALAKGGDLDILNFALTLEYLEAAFYAKATKTLNLSGETKKVATLIGEHEAMHVKGLTAAIKGAGGTPVKAPGVKFPFKDQASFLKLAQVFEDTGVSAYNGAAPMITSPDVLATAGTIVQVEARHAAAIRFLNGAAPAPTAFDKPLQKQAVLTAVKPFITG
ncbi:MAG: hypothetical protein QOG06_1851 [Gaiellaceae bacterium]|jgi:hypothetical protein|nr:hypothetical protein [Gaiellaceae bacterium]